MTRLTLIFVVTLHILVCVVNLAAFLILPFTWLIMGWSFWYTVLLMVPIQSALLRLAFDREQCPLTKWENALRRKLGMREVGGFVSYYFIKRRWLNGRVQPVRERHEEPAITINDAGLCNICELYDANFDPNALLKEIDFLMTLRHQRVMVGLSGGKDSTVALFIVREQLGLTPIAFTFNTGYYPEHIFPRAKLIAASLGAHHHVIDIRPYMRTNDRIAYQATAWLYDTDSENTGFTFKELYALNRKHYSVKHQTPMPYVRPCQLCRKVVIRAYYEEAVKRGIKVVVLGMNEWAGLSNNKFTAIRKLKPYEDRPEVYIVHLPFLMRKTIKSTAEILSALGWKAPEGEHLVESNSNSCLLARASEKKAKRLLGFHPDSPRLSREITAGFLTKEHAKKALVKEYECDYSVGELLKKAGIL
jgi:tRNA(Ile)-lysidine synthase TilS/MesJ